MPSVVISIAGHCGHVLTGKQWGAGQSLGCTREDVKVVSHPKTDYLQGRVDIMCRSCKQRPVVIPIKEQPGEMVLP